MSMTPWKQFKRRSNLCMFHLAQRLSFMATWHDGRSCFVDIKYEMALNWTYFIDCLLFTLFGKMLISRVWTFNAEESGWIYFGFSLKGIGNRVFTRQSHLHTRYIEMGKNCWDDPSFLWMPLDIWLIIFVENWDDCFWGWFLKGQFTSLVRNKTDVIRKIPQWHALFVQLLQTILNGRRHGCSDVRLATVEICPKDDFVSAESMYIWWQMKQQVCINCWLMLPN